MQKNGNSIILQNCLQIAFSLTNCERNNSNILFLVKIHWFEHNLNYFCLTIWIIHVTQYLRNDQKNEGDVLENKSGDPEKDRENEGVIFIECKRMMQNSQIDASTYISLLNLVPIILFCVVAGFVILF